MPYLIRRPRPRRLMCAAASAMALAVALPAAAAACTVSTANESQPFATYGDSSWYTLAPGGSFVSGAHGWRLTNATIQSGGSSFPDALTIAPNGTAMSAPICVSSETPTFRFFGRQDGGYYAEVNVNVLWTNTNGQAEDVTAGGGNVGSSWAPSGVYELGAMLPTESGTAFSVRLQFIPAATGGAVQIDDLYVDPYST
ncbi:MAG: hypothetical protein ACLP0J_18065 [Solirubrobacteraceae bacterium]